MHHANLLIGSKTWGRNRLPHDDRAPSLDVVWYDRESFAIDDARALAREALLRPVERDVRVFVIAAETILPPAQNALLKLLEEPSPDTVFYLIIPQGDMLLPTLRSRLYFLDAEALANAAEDFEPFRKLPYAERLKLIEARLEAEDDAWVERIVRGFEVYAEERKEPALMEDAMRVAAYVHGPGSSKKMLLEHIALTL